MHQTISRRAALGLSLAAGAELVLPCRARAADQTIRIGVLTDMMSTYAVITGQGCVLGAHFAIEDFTKVHPEIKVELLSADQGGTNPTGLHAPVNELI